MNFRHPGFRSPLLWLAVVLAAPFLPILIAPGGRVLGDRFCDNPSMFYFINEFSARCLRQGIIPLWNPHIMLGLPFLAEGQAAIFHPLSWLFVLLPTGVALNWIDAICFVLTGLFFFGYLRSLKLSRDTSFLGALVWSFSNIMISRVYAGHITNLLIFAEMPLMLMFWERYRETRRIGKLIGICLTYTAMIAAAHPQFLYIFSLFFLFYVLIQSAPALADRAQRMRELRGIALLGGFILLAMLIGAAQLLPSIELAGESFRSKSSFGFNIQFSFIPWNLLTLVIPRFYGYAAEGGASQYWGPCNFWEMWAYIGILPLILVVPGIMAAPARRRAGLGICAVIFLLIAFGPFTPFFGWVLKALPMMNMFRGPSKNILVTEICLITFSAYGLEALLHPGGGGADGKRLKAALAWGGVLLGICALCYALLLQNYESMDSTWQQIVARMDVFTQNTHTWQEIVATARWAIDEMTRAAFLIVLSMAVIAMGGSGKWKRRLPAIVGAVILADLLWLFFPLLKTYPESITRCPEELVSPLRNYPYPPRVLNPVYYPAADTPFYPNMAMHYGFCSPSGYSGNALERFNTFVNICLQKPPETAEVTDPICNYGPVLRMLAMDASFMQTKQIGGNMTVLARSGETGLVSFKNHFPRAFLAASPKFYDQKADVLKYVFTESNDLIDSPVIERKTAAGAAPLGVGEGVRFVSFGPSRVELEARADRARVLVLCEMFEKNWTARVGDKPAAVFPANYLFRGVEVPAGTSRVVFEYRPASFRRGVIVSLVALAVLLGIALVQVAAGRRAGAVNRAPGAVNYVQGVVESEPPVGGKRRRGSGRVRAKK